ncbi:MAG TPA: sialidase family protein [Kofleriaceae bacterium]|nr:sialidase family protein [Kofleriaceae bacterium]
MAHPAEPLIAVLALAAAAGCGDNLPPDPFLGLVRVSGGSPYSTGCGGPQSGTNYPGIEVEPSVAVDPTDPAHLVGAWQQDRWANGGSNGIGIAASFDGGTTWTLGVPHFGRCSGGNADNGGDYERATDPWVTFAADGTPFVIGMMFDGTSPRNAMAAIRSGDGGLSWSEPTVLRADDDPNVLNDKESITADPKDPGRVYAVWDRVTGLLRPNEPVGTGPTWFARTSEGAWEPARPIYDPGIDAQTVGNVIAVLPDGTLVCVFAQITKVSSQTPSTTLGVIRSTDKGMTWSAATLVAPMEGPGVRDPNNNEPVRSGGGLPAIAVDRKTGAIYVAWEGSRAGMVVDGAMMVRSLDGGVTWSEPAQINGVPDVSAFTPMVAVTDDGAVGVTYYDLRAADLGDPSMFRAAAWLAISRDQGATWSDEPLGAAFDLRPASLTTSYFLGDYEGLTAVGNTLLAFFVGATVDSDDKTDVFVYASR